MLRQFIKLNALKSYKFISLCTAENLHSTHLRFVEEKTDDMENKQIKSMLGKYNAAQEEKILKILNNYSLNDLLGYEISKARANKLIDWRKRYGLLQSLDDVFCIEGFGLNKTEKFFGSLLREPKTNEEKLRKSKTRTAPFIAPQLEAEQKKAIKSVVSMRIGVNSVTWCRLNIPGRDKNAPCLLTHWEHHEISEKKLHINELIQRCLYVNHLIPVADCYVFENPQLVQGSIPGGAEKQNINIQKSQVAAMLGYALTARKHRFCDRIINETTELPNVFYIRRFLSARLFNRLVGTERVSSEDTILSMMRTFYNTDEMQNFLAEQIPVSDLPSSDNEVFSTGVQFPMAFREIFSKAPRYHREFLGQAILLNLAFVRLVLLQDAESIAKVSKGGNNDAS